MLCQALNGAQHPAYYLAIPPPMFEAVIEHLAKSGCAQGARFIIEKPFGRDLTSAQKLNRLLLATFAEWGNFRARWPHLPRFPLPVIGISQISISQMLKFENPPSVCASFLC